MSDAFPTKSAISDSSSRSEEAGLTHSYHTAGPHYGDLTPHARGGLGEVFSATDATLHRTVAVKRLLDNRVSDPECRRRFLMEAEVTARLEHPGVVPVYTLFTDDRGGPAYAMRFVKGPTLWDAIKEYHATTSDPVAFRRLLQSFIQVCQTIAYAHSRGVIHRDLKPQNVMIGKFGETLVVDWGLAKVVGRPEEVRSEVPTEATLVPGSGSGDETAMGSAVGTPAYMSPEQAAGRWNVIDHRSDVYGLGAVLYTILTGRPPLEKGDWPEMQQKIQQGEIVRPRSVKPEISAALESICVQAMALKPESRYASAEAVAADVEHWLADEPVRAYRDLFATRVRRWMRRHRTLVSASVVVLITAVVGLSIGTVLLNRARVETEQQRVAARAAQDEAESARKKSDAINRFLVDDLLKQADPANNPVGDKITVRELLDKAAQRLDRQTDLAEQTEVEIEIRRVIGLAYRNLLLVDKAEPQYRRAVELQSALLGPDQPDTWDTRNRLVDAIVQQGGPRAEPTARETLEACKHALGDRDPQSALAANNLAYSLLDLGRYDEARQLLLPARDVLRATWGPNHEKSLEVDNDLAAALVFLGNSAEAESIFRSLIERYQMINSRHTELPITTSNLGGTITQLGRYKEAESILRQAIALGTEIQGEKSRDVFRARNYLGYSLEGQQRWNEAEKEYQSALADRRQFDPKNSGGIRFSLAFLGRFYAKQQKWVDAANHLAELMLLTKPDPKRKLDELSVTLLRALTDMTDPQTAEPVIRECYEAFQNRMGDVPDWMTYELGSRYGDCLRRQGKYEEAERLLVHAAQNIAKAVGVPAWGNSAARKRVADLYTDWNKPDEAAKWK